jgi:hypothetical protein
MSDEDKDKDQEDKGNTKEAADSEESLAEEVDDFVSKVSGLDSDAEDQDGEPVTVETVQVRKNSKTNDGGDGADSPQTESPSKDDSDSASAQDKKDGQQDAPQMSLQDMGIGQEALPELDPETGQLTLDGTAIEEGVKVFIYNDKGQPVFGFMLEDGSVVITPEEAASSIAFETRPKKKKKKKKKKSQRKTSSKTKSEVALKGTAERRARATARATGRRPSVAPEKKKSSFILTFFMMLSTISCLGLIAWFYMFDGKTYVQKYLHPEMQTGATPDSKDQMPRFEPRAFAPADMDVDGEVDAAQAQLTESGWIIAAPKDKPKWALWSSGVIENGIVNGKGTIQLKRKGKDDFLVSFLVGFYKGPKDIPDSQGNMTLLLNAPKARKKVFFGFGVQLNKLFLVPFIGSKKEDERRHAAPVNMAFNTWYKVDAKAEGRFVNFYFNGKKIDGIQLNADDVKDVALTNIQSRVFYRDFTMQEDGVDATTTTVKPADANAEPDTEIKEEN